VTSRALLAAALLVAARTAAAEPGLPSWNEGAARRAIVEFVRAVTDEDSGDFVQARDRVAVFDNDGTLWCEQPLYFQAVFLLDQFKAAAPAHPEWKEKPAFAALTSGDRDAIAKVGLKPVMELVAAANSGMTVAEYQQSIRGWLASARHPRFKRPYTGLVYKPMQELLAYLRDYGFKTYIVSGGGIEFMRGFAEDAYGIPPEQVVGSISEVKFEVRDGEPVLVRGPKVEFVDDGPGKPVGIYRAIGRRPLAAFGNSDGDLQMLQFTAAGEGRRLALIVHHDDAEREYAYDRASRIGQLDKALDEAKARGWVVVSMKGDWKQVFPFEDPK
jgi:phosphoglycolate phosphatase-like HAD superfamily hydrolase